MNLSKKPKLVEIEGIDEAGRVGERILFVRLGVPLPSESSVLLQNLQHFDNLIVRHEDLKGKDEGTLLRYAKEVLDNPQISFTIFVLREATQLKLLRQLMHLQGDACFLHRKTLIQIIRGEQYETTRLSEAISDLAVFENEPVHVESFLKAFAIRKIVMKLETMSPLLRDPRDLDRLLVIQVDGGFPFVFWWKNLVDSGVCPKLRRGSVLFSGITAGDAHYPVVSTAGAVASILRKCPQHSYLYPTRELEIEDDSELPTQDFYRGHVSSLTRPTFQARMLLIGDIGSTVACLLPYALHRTDRSRTWEVFPIEKSVEDFLHAYGPGGPDNTIAVYGALKTQADKEGLKFLREEGYTCNHTTELKSCLQELFGDLSNDADLLPSKTKSTIQGKLDKLKHACEAELG